MPANISRRSEQLRAQVEQNCDYVGEKFPEEARRIHYGETEKRNIYGEASPDEAKELIEEGVEVQAIPGLLKQTPDSYIPFSYIPVSAYR